MWICAVHELDAQAFEAFNRATITTVNYQKPHYKLQIAVNYVVMTEDD